MKKLLALGGAALAVLAVVLLIRSALAGPEKTVGRMLDKLAAGRLSKAASYTVEDSLNLEGKSWSAKRFYKKIFGTIHYTVTGSEVDGDSARVTVAVTMVDVSALLADASMESLDASLFPSSYRKKIMGRIQDGEVDYVLNTVSVYLEKDGGRWRVSMSDSGKFADAITGGMGDLIGY